MRLAVIVNPDAGLGGRLGFKGSDGRAAEARAAGAEDRAGPRMVGIGYLVNIHLQGKRQHKPMLIQLQNS